MRRRSRAGPPQRIEPPLWYRVFDAAAWDEPDGQELRMMNGHLGREWPEELHRIHAERRWHQAKHAYCQDHPALAEQEFADIMEEIRRS